LLSGNRDISKENEDMTNSNLKLDDEELQVICNIIEAAIWYTVAEELEMGISPKST
jgi:hypothetical protein